MRLIKNYGKNFLLRGLVAMGFGPLVLAVIYGISGLSGDVASVPFEEMVLGIISITALAFICGGMTIVYQIEELSLPKAIAAHGLALYVAYATMYITNSWIEEGIVPFLVFTGIFILGYALIWLAIYLVTKNKTDKLNKNLNSK